MSCNKLLFFLKRPRLILIAGSGTKTAKEAVLKVMSNHFKIGKEVFVCDQYDKEAEFLLKVAKSVFLVFTHLGEYHPDREFFAGEIGQAGPFWQVALNLSAQNEIILNFDDETVRDLKNKTKARLLTFGFGFRADVRASDVVLTQFPGQGTNFKINHEGNIVPCWLANLFGKEHIYAALAATGVGLAMGLNLVEISEGLRNYSGVSD